MWKALGVLLKHVLLFILGSLLLHVQYKHKSSSNLFSLPPLEKLGFDLVAKVLVGSIQYVLAEDPVVCSALRTDSSF